MSRLFFALWPTDAARKSLAKLQAGLGLPGKLVPVENFHITLVFLGNVGEAMQPCVGKTAAGITAAPFDIRLERIGNFSSGVVWSGPVATPSELGNLVGKLNRKLIDCGFRPETRPFRPHLTLARKARERVAEKVHAPIEWRAKDFCLVESRTLPSGVQYRVLQRWDL